jgi:hypothetical protein
MEILRDAHGAERLGTNNRAEISRILAGIGLGHVPVVLPSYQNDQVRLFKRGTVVGELIETVLTPGDQNDKQLVEQFNEQSTDYTEIVKQIRELVCEP